MNAEMTVVVHFARFVVARNVLGDGAGYLFVGEFHFAVLQIHADGEFQRVQQFTRITAGYAQQGRPFRDFDIELRQVFVVRDGVLGNLLEFIVAVSDSSTYTRVRESKGRNTPRTKGFRSWSGSTYQFFHGAQQTVLL